MRNILSTIALVTILSFMPSVVQADEKDDRIQALEEQLLFLAAEIQALKAESIIEKEEIAAVKTEIEEISVIAAKIEPASGSSASDVKITMSPSPKFEYGDVSFQPFGRIHLDYAVFDDDAADHPNGGEFRRARMGMKGTVAEDFGYKVEVDFANEGVSFKDVYMNYSGIDGVDIRLGHFKPGFGLEENTSANTMAFIERPAVSSAFATGEIIGLGSLFHGDDWSVSVGAFNDDAGTNSADDEAWYVTGRGTFAPINEERKALHLGASVGHRKPDQATDTFDFDATAENTIQTMDAVSANFTNADSADLYGVEGAFTLGSWLAQAEYFMVDVDRNGGNNALEFDGGYAQLSYVLTGEARPYKGKAGKFGRIVPDKPFNLKKGEWGAWELAGRYSSVDLSDEDVLGGEMDNYTIGLNWYLQKHVRLMANYISVDTDQNAVTPNDDPQILLFRAQVDF